MSAPLVSVLMVSHNGGRHLEPAVRSVLDQTGPALEVVLVDNASTDGAVTDAARRLRDPRLRIVHSEENTFHGGGLNLALAAARGELIAMMDHDDLSCPGRFARQSEFLLRDRQCAGVATFEEEMDEAGVTVAPMFCVRRADQLLPYSRYDIPFPMHNLMLRRAALTGLPWRNEFPWAMDFDFVQRLLERHQVGVWPEILYRYRVHSQAISAQHGIGQRHAATLCRLVAARRRAGRDEGLAGMHAEFEAARAGSLPLREMWSRYAARFLAEGFPDLAIMLARRAWGAGARRAGMTVAWRALLAARRAPAPARRLLWRLAWLGPAHALRIESHPPLRARGWNLFRSGWQDMHGRVAAS